MTPGELDLLAEALGFESAEAMKRAMGWLRNARADMPGYNDDATTTDPTASLVYRSN